MSTPISTHPIVGTKECIWFQDKLESLSFAGKGSPIFMKDIGSRFGTTHKASMIIKTQHPNIIYFIIKDSLDPTNIIWVYSVVNMDDSIHILNPSIDELEVIVAHYFN